MNGTHRLRRWAWRILMSLAVLGLLVASVSHAQVTLDQVVTGALDATQSKVDKTKPPKVSVPEPDTTSLLVIGLGMTGLVAYGVDRRKRVA
jgi:hypothetical protein